MTPTLRRRLAAAASLSLLALPALAVSALVVSGLVVSGCSSSAPTTVATTTLPEALWTGQARVWLGTHSSALTAISSAAKDLGSAAKAGNANLTQIAASDMLVQVGLADGTLPDNAFGHDLHQVFVEYALALATIRKGILNNDQATFKSGSNALAKAVTDFGKLTVRMDATP